VVHLLVGIIALSKPNVTMNTAQNTKDRIMEFGRDYISYNEITERMQLATSRATRIRSGENGGGKEWLFACIYE